MRVLVVVLIAISLAASYDNDSVEEFVQSDMPDMDEDLLQVVDKLRGVVPGHMTFHVDRIKHHATLLQSKSWDDAAPKAYSHNYSSSKAAITSALRGLTDQLQAGHTHDVNALKTGESDAKKATNDAKTNGKTATGKYRNKACPTKRKEIEADNKKKKAKETMQNIAKEKICTGLKTTFGDMDIDKSAPKYGTELRNGWDKATKRRRRLPGRLPPRSMLRLSPLTTPPWLLSRLPSMLKLRTLTLHARTQPTNTRPSSLRSRAT